MDRNVIAMPTAGALEIISSNGFGSKCQANEMTYGPFIHHHILPNGIKPGSKCQANEMTYWSFIHHHILPYETNPVMRLLQVVPYPRASALRDTWKTSSNSLGKAHTRHLHWLEVVAFLWGDTLPFRVEKFPAQNILSSFYSSPSPWQNVSNMLTLWQATPIKSYKV